MKTPHLLVLLAFCGISAALCQSEKEATPPPSTKTEDAKPPKPAKLELVRFRGKTGKPSTNVKVSTRAGNQSAIRIVAIAPGNEGITFKPQPRLWWHQNEATEPGELEFVLTRLGSGTPSEVLRLPIPKMNAGYNPIDLSNPKVNPKSVTMDSGIPYQWTINVRSGMTSSPVYSRVTFQNDPNPAAPNTPIEERLRTLGELGNWYELFDLTSSGAELEVPAGPLSGLRIQLLTGIRLIGEIK